MYPEKPELKFDCDCPVLERKNIWNDVTGVHVRYCPMCGSRAEQFYEPSQVWEETGRGLKGEPMPDHIYKAKAKADAERASSGVGVRPVKRHA